MNTLRIQRASRRYFTIKRGEKRKWTLCVDEEISLHYRGFGITIDWNEEITISMITRLSSNLRLLKHLPVIFRFCLSLSFRQAWQMREFSLLLTNKRKFLFTTLLANFRQFIFLKTSFVRATLESAEKCSSFCWWAETSVAAVAGKWKLLKELSWFWKAF